MLTPFAFALVTLAECAAAGARVLLQIAGWAMKTVRRLDGDGW